MPRPRRYRKTTVLPFLNNAWGPKADRVCRIHPGKEIDVRWTFLAPEERQIDWRGVVIKKMPHKHLFRERSERVYGMFCPVWLVRYQPLLIAGQKGFPDGLEVEHVFLDNLRTYAINDNLCLSWWGANNDDELAIPAKRPKPIKYLRCSQCHRTASVIDGYSDYQLEEENPRCLQCDNACPWDTETESENENNDECESNDTSN